MRIKEEFATDRLSGVIEYKPKYFIASEGSSSEPMYFEGLNKSILSENVSIINILRDYATISNSHPTFITNMLKEFILNVTTYEITVGEIKNKILNCIHDNDMNIDSDKIFNELDNIYKHNDKYRIKKSDLSNLFLKLFKGNIYEDLVENFSLYFEAQNTTYSPEKDSLNMVVDRDKQNFKEEQYDKVLEFCEKYNVNLYVSNPTFEFWLLLHFEEVVKEDNTAMYENKPVNRSRRYLEKRLHDICGYKKSKLNFKIFEANIGDAIKREKLFTEDVKLLKDNLGSNVGILIGQMLDKK